MRTGDFNMFSVLDFIHRNARIATALSVVVVAVSTAGAIGWMTAPV